MAAIDYASAARMEIGNGRPKLAGMRKCASTPTLRSLGATPDCDSLDGMEVYVVMRSFQEFGGGIFSRLPGRLQEGVRDCGMCHYMTVFRQPDGTFVQFDFGPKAGGDIHVGHGPLAKIFNKSPNAKRRKGVSGDVREHKLTSLPAEHMYVGKTPLSIGDIRAWNDVHAQIEYELHRSDCRHYVNSLVAYTTGVEKATVSALKYQWSKNKDKYGIANAVVQLGHLVTDIANWGTVKAIGQASMASLMTLTGRKAVGGLVAPQLLQGVKTKLLPVARSGLVPVRRAITTRPVAVGTAAVATFAASTGQAPTAIKETVTLGARVAGGVQSAVRAAASLAQSVGRQASAATQHTTSQAVAVASGIAGAASRGAAIMAKQTSRRVSLMPQHARAGNSSPRVTFPAERNQHLAIVATQR